MRHLKKRNKLSRPTSHRNAVLVNLCKSLIIHNRIKTTKTKAKMVQPIIEKLITKSKHNTLHAKRTVASKLHGWEVIPRLFDEIGPKFAERKGGYTRVIKLGFRDSDGAEMAIIEFVEEFESPKKTQKETKPAQEVKAKPQKTEKEKAKDKVKEKPKPEKKKKPEKKGKDKKKTKK